MEVNDQLNHLTLMDLDDDSLLEIFKYLTIEETFSLLGHVNRRLDEIALDRIKDLKHLTISMREPPKYSQKELIIISKNLKTLYISAGYSLPSSMTLYYLKPLCGINSSYPTASCLEQLTLHYIQLNPDYQQCIMNVAPKLKRLDLSFCQLSDELLIPILECAYQLDELAIIGNYELRCSSLDHIKSKDLRKIQLQLIPDCTDNVNNFIVKNPQIQVLCYGPNRFSFKVHGPVQ